MTAGAAHRERRAPATPLEATSRSWTDAIRLAVADGLRRIERGAERVHVTTPAPAAPIQALFGTPGAEPSVFWLPPSGWAVAGSGVAFECRLDGSVEELRDAIAEALSKLEVIAPEGAPPPRVVGGLAFAPGMSEGTPFAPLGDGVFRMPRVSYLRHDDEPRAWLSFCFDSERQGRQILESLDGLVDTLITPSTVAPTDAGGVHRITYEEREPFLRSVADVRTAIEAGEVKKVVVARRSEVRAERPLSALGVLERLVSRFGSCTRFGIFFLDVDDSGSAHDAPRGFVGATPECLVTRAGARVHTEALAGSMPRGEGEALLASEKDRSEHRFVVEAIVASLEPLCAAVTHDPSPSTRELPDVVHMRTPIEGRLRDGAHVLDLVAALHPTPAVGGVPREAAMAWIRDREPSPRGWYSAPFGWVDADGDGSFVVALRAGVIEPSAAHVYAGAGIVRDSEPTREYDETALKMRALLGALSGE